MKQIFLVIVFVIVAAGFGCSDNAPDAPERVIAEPAPVSNIADITDPNAALAEGNRLFDENQTQLAIDAFRHAVSLNPDLADAHFALGIAYALLEMQNAQAGIVTEPAPDSKTEPAKTNSERSFEKAVKAYEKRIDANRQDDAAYFNLGRTYVKLLKDEDAEKAFKEAAELKPEDTEYQTELGAILIRLAQYHQAIAPLKKAIELDPNNARAQELLEDAQAGRQRIDYVPPDKNTNRAANKVSNSNANTSANSNANSAARPPDANAKPKDPVEKRPLKTPGGPRSTNR